jgi:hypothetical protein
VQTGGATRIGRYSPWQALSEDPPGAGGCLTEEPADSALNGDGDAVPGEIGEGADVATVRARTSRRRGDRRHLWLWWP